MGIGVTGARAGGWTVGPVSGRRPAGVARDAVHPGSGARAVLVVVDERFSDRMPPDAALVARAASVGSPAVMPMLDAGLLDDGTRWYVTPPAPAAVLDPSAGCSPRRAAAIVGSVASALAAVHAAGLVHGLVGPQTVVPAAGRHAGGAAGTTLLLDAGVAALLGDRAADLATASGVSAPADRGPAADVYALGALLLRLLTAAAPAGPALAATPTELRGLLAAMLDEDPASRPAAAAVARRLAGLREGLLGTAPVELPPMVPRRAAPPPRTRAVPAAPAPAPAPAPATFRAAVGTAATAARSVAPPTTAPAPPHRAGESSGRGPRPVTAAAPSLLIGPLPARSTGRVVPRRGTRLLLIAGGVGLAGLFVGVATHLPIGRDSDAVAAAADDGVLAVGPAQLGTVSPTARSSAGPASGVGRRASTTATTGTSSAGPAVLAQPATRAPSPLAAATTSSAPSRSTSTPPSTIPTSTTPTDTTPTDTSPTRSTAPRTAAAPVSSAPVSSSPAPTQSTVSTDPITPTEAGTPTDAITPPETALPSDTIATPTGATASGDPATTDPATTDPAMSGAG